ncbi:MAG: SNF2-related protein [Clostridia bacterium]|nr:SNF2-related protein [Clostridia bacterium]
MRKVLYPEQVDALKFLTENTNVINCSGTGTGKTLVTLTAVQHILATDPKAVCFITCPKAANSIFKREMAGLGLPLTIVTAEERSVIRGVRICLFNYSKYGDMLGYLSRCVNAGYKILGVFDEVHTLASASSQQAKQIRRHRHLFWWVIGCTATPLLNDLEGTWRIVNFIQPGVLGSLSWFQKKYLIRRDRQMTVKGKPIVFKEVVGHRDLDDLAVRLNMMSVAIRRQYTIHNHFYDCTITPAEMADYREAVKGIINVQEEEKTREWSARLHDLQKVVDGSHERMTAIGESKVKLLVATLQEILARNEGALVYTEYEDTYQMLGSRVEQEKRKGDLPYNRLFYITGKVSTADRVRVEQQLAAGDVVILTRAGCQSINLQGVNNVVFYSIPFALEWVIQCVGRVARIDTKYTEQHVYYLSVAGTIDEYKRRMMEAHTYVIESVFGKEPNLPSIREADAKSFEQLRQVLKREYLWKFREQRFHTYAKV